MPKLLRYVVIQHHSSLAFAAQPSVELLALSLGQGYKDLIATGRHSLPFGIDFTESASTQQGLRQINQYR